jgi:cell wall assembly regulator SMI1
MMMDRSRRKVLIGGFAIGALAAAGLLPTLCARRPEANRDAAATARRKRPPGAPKPLLDEDIAPVLARLDAWYAEHLPPDLYAFNPPAREAELDAFEHLVGIGMPRAYRQLYRWHDGEKDDRHGHIYGLPLLPLRQAGSQWKAWTELLADPGGNLHQVPAGSWPEGAADPVYINRRWIPLTHDGSGNHIGLDFDPWPRGRIGQVILFGRDEDVKAVLAESLGTFLAWIAQLLESGNFRLKAEEGEVVLRPFRLKDPPADDFHEGARALLGAPGPFL